MKILLAACNAKYIHSNLAVYSLRAYAREYAQNIVVREYTINQQKDDILRDIYLQKPDVVCVSCYIWNISYVRELMCDLAKILPGAVLWAGGPEVSFDAEAFLEANPFFTGVMVGEGEQTFLELVRYYVEGESHTWGDIALHDSHVHEPWHQEEDAGHADAPRHQSSSDELSGIRGIAYRHGEQICHNGWREIMDLSTLPFVYENLEDFHNRILYYESSRGCPFSCSYCLSSVDKKLRFRSLELVKKELQFFIDHKVPQVKFVDRTFNCRHDHAMAVWKYIADHDNGVTNFHFEVSADLLTDEELSLMRTMRPGLIQLEIGVQSTNADTIRGIHRTMDFAKLSTVVNQIHSFVNIHQHLDLIAGLPYEDYESFRRSFNDVYNLRPQQLQLGFLKVLKGSLMKETAAEYGIIHKEKEPYEVLSTKWLPFRDVLKLKMVESMVEVYYNSGQFQNTLEYLKPYFTDAFSFYEALGMFYEERGYTSLSHARMRRYEILLEFLEGYSCISQEETADHMMLDLYLRENIKSRPAFALSQKPYEKVIWEYRRREKVPKTAHIEVFRNNKALLFDYSRRDPLTNNAAITDITLVFRGFAESGAK